MSKTSKSKKYIREGFSWNLRGPIDQESKALRSRMEAECVLAIAYAMINFL